MKGIHKISVRAKRIRFDFTVRRNITVIRGDSATGKTTLVDMIRQHINNPSGSPVEVVCDKTCYVLEGALWESELGAIHDGIVFIDEGNAFVSSMDFAAAIQNTDNYYVIVTREGLNNLAYSTEEIYGIHSAGKYGSLQQTYNEFYRIYGEDVYTSSLRPDVVITEDTNSGYEFFSSVCGRNGTKCESAQGKSNMFRLAQQSQGHVLLVADGAAFGPQMDRIMKLIGENHTVSLYVPESFEWLILKSGLFSDHRVGTILKNPADYIESSQYLSWERFFTALLVRESHGTYLEYNKRKLNPNYLKKNAIERIIAVMDKIDLG